MDYETANYIVLIINTFMCLSSPLNLAIYCGMSKQFRDQFSHIELWPCISCVQVTASTIPASAPRASATSLLPGDTVAVAECPSCPYLAENKRGIQRDTAL